jgi:hypothetical protein
VQEFLDGCAGSLTAKPRPRCRVLRRPPTVFIHPKGSSIRLRLIVLMRWPGWRIVRAPIAERRLLSFCGTCGVQPRFRQPATKSAVS